VRGVSFNSIHEIRHEVRPALKLDLDLLLCLRCLFVEGLDAVVAAA